MSIIQSIDNQVLKGNKLNQPYEQTRTSGICYQRSSIKNDG
jgi:hypothetical protein